jgi:hypothetical protein
VIPEYQAPYSDDGVYGDFTYGTPGVSRGFVNALCLVQGGMPLRFKGKSRILVIGAGNGYEIAVFLTRGHECYGIDLYIPDIKFVKEVSVRGDARSMPYKDKEFDLVFCGETFEHIPEDVCLEIMSEVNRVGRAFYFTIATRDDGDYKTHINVQPAWWWIKQFTEAGFRILHAEENAVVPILYSGNGLIKFTYRDGVTICGNCNSKESESPALP